MKELPLNNRRHLLGCVTASHLQFIESVTIHPNFVSMKSHDARFCLGSYQSPIILLAAKFGCMDFASRNQKKISIEILYVGPLPNCEMSRGLYKIWYYLGYYHCYLATTLYRPLDFAFNCLAYYHQTVRPINGRWAN